MAPKKNVSKNQRVGTLGVAKKSGVDAAQRLMLPLDGGRHAYVLDVPSGRNLHVATGSDEFWAAIDADVADGYGARLSDEFAVLAALHPFSPWPALSAEFAARTSPAAAA